MRLRTSSRGRQASEHVLRKLRKSPPTAVQSAVETSVQAAPTTPELSPEPSAAAGSDVAPSVTVEASPQAGPDAAAGPTTTPQTVPPWENQDIVFLQRPGVNIRSTPAANGPAVGTAPKGTRFTATRREGDWTQVENGRLKGWINSQFLAPEPSAAAVARCSPCGHCRGVPPSWSGRDCRTDRDAPNCSAAAEPGYRFLAAPRCKH